MEIERKYLIKHMPPDIEKAGKLEIEQGYLSRGPVVRVRKSNDDYILTFKQKSDRSGLDGNPVMNEEYEFSLSKEAYEHLREKADNHIIIKTRYVIGLDNGLKAELDVFHGRLEGLRFVEVEFPDVETAASFVPPEWFGKDVSSDKRYSNGHLSELDSIDEFMTE